MRRRGYRRDCCRLRQQTVQASSGSTGKPAGTKEAQKQPRQWWQEDNEVVIRTVADADLPPTRLRSHDDRLRLLRHLHMQVRHGL